MTIFCGVFDIGNETGCVSGLNSMMHFLADRPADCTNTWHCPSVSLGQKTLHATPESFKENLPLHHCTSGLTIVGDIRLDNRAELFSKLFIPKPEQDNYGDGRLILAAYEKWGELCPEHLLGDFSFAIWDSIRQKLCCCTDHFGIRGMFYFNKGDKFVFASFPDIIQQMPGIPSAINHNKLSTLIFKDAKHLFWEESWFENIFPIPAATIMTADATGIRKRKYWTPEIKDELTFKNEDEFAEAFQEVLFRAVSDRLRSQAPVTALLSGGLDSSAVASVAAKILEKQNRELQVLSAVLPNDAGHVLTDERYFIDQFRSFSNVNINYITAPGRGFFSGVEALKTTIHSPNLISRHYLNTSFYEKAQSLGSRVILDGIGGELGATFHGDGIYAEMFWRMRWLKLCKEITARKTLVGESIYFNLRSDVVAPLLPAFITNLLNRQNIGLSKTRPNCIQQDFAEKLKEELRSKQTNLERLSHGVSPSHRLNQLRMLQMKQSKAQGTGDLGQVEQRSPLMDKRLLEFCLAAPLDFKIRNGYKRYLVRAGLNKVLPAEIQWRNSKGPFSPDYNSRYKEQLPQVKQFLATIQPNDPVCKVVDVEKIKLWTNIPLSDIETGTFAEKAARDFVPQGIYLIYFLRRFKEFMI